VRFILGILVVLPVTVLTWLGVDMLRWRYLPVGNVIAIEAMDAGGDLRPGGTLSFVLVVRRIERECIPIFVQPRLVPVGSTIPAWHLPPYIARGEARDGEPLGATYALPAQMPPGRYTQRLDVSFLCGGWRSLPARAVGAEEIEVTADRGRV
jgi:hypothetical protein